MAVIAVPTIIAQYEDVIVGHPHERERVVGRLVDVRFFEGRSVTVDPPVLDLDPVSRESDNPFDESRCIGVDIW